MKKFLVTVISMTALSAVALADAGNNNFFVKLNGGFSHSDKFKHNYTDSASKNHKLGDSGLFGLGFGNNINENLAVEVDVDYRPGFKEKFTATTLNNAGALVIGNANARVRALTSFVNLKWSFGNYNGFSPFITAGAGLARNEMKKFHFTGAGFTKTYKSQAHSNFAYNVGTGFKFNLNNETKLETKYRYANIGHVESSKSANGAAVNPYKSKKVGLHEGVISLVYEF